MEEVRYEDLKEMEEVKYEDLEEFVPENWTVREFIDWLKMWLTDEEMDLPFFIDNEPVKSYHVFVSYEFPLGDTANPHCEYIKAVCMS